MLHRVWVMGRGWLFAVALALLGRDHLTQRHAINAAQGVHHSALDVLSAWRRVAVLQQKGDGSTAHADAAGCLGAVALFDFTGKQGNEQRRLFAPGGQVYSGWLVHALISWKS